MWSFHPTSYRRFLTQSKLLRENGKIVLEAETHLPNNWVRCVSLSPTEGLERGAEAIDTGAPVRVPVGKATLGRLFNVLGEPSG